MTVLSVFIFALKHHKPVCEVWVYKRITDHIQQLQTALLIFIVHSQRAAHYVWKLKKKINVKVSCAVLQFHRRVNNITVTQKNWPIKGKENAKKISFNSMHYSFSEIWGQIQRSSIEEVHRQNNQRCSFSSSFLCIRIHIIFFMQNISNFRIRLMLGCTVSFLF